MLSIQVVVSEILYCTYIYGFTQSKSDYSLFYAGKGKNFVAILVYVDDIIVASKFDSVISRVKTTL